MKKHGMLLMLFVAVFALRCNRSQPPPSSEDPHHHPEAVLPHDVVQLSEASSELADIELEEVNLRKCNSLLKLTGRVIAPQPNTVIISHAFSARVAEVHVEVGEAVRKGQPLVTLECEEVGQARSEFYKAVADLELAQINLAREERLLESGIGVKKNHVAAEAAQKVAQAVAEAAEKKLHVLGFTEEQVKEIADTHQINPSITLYSPLAGKVVSNHAVRGALVDQLTEILKIIDLSLLWVDAEVFEKDIAKVKRGQTVAIVVPAYPEEVFQGKVTYIGDVVQENTRTITVRATRLPGRQGGW